MRAVLAAGAYAEFSFFVLTHATQVGLTHVVEAFREYMLLLESAGFSEEEIRTMNSTNPGEG